MIFFSDINECDVGLMSNPCQNNGTCMNSYGSYYCVCKEGWSGPNCTNGKIKQFITFSFIVLNDC